MCLKEDPRISHLIALYEAARRGTGSTSVVTPATSSLDQKPTAKEGINRVTRIKRTKGHSRASLKVGDASELVCLPPARSAGPASRNVVAQRQR